MKDRAATERVGSIAEKRKIRRSQVEKYDKAKTEPSQAIYFHIISRLCGMWRDIRE
jgi:hypothetical protein